MDGSGHHDRGVGLPALGSRPAAWGESQREARPPRAYYEDVVRAETRADLSAGLRRDGSDPQPRLLRALRETSRIARAKNRCVRYAIVVLLPAITAAFLAVALGR
ncbi:Pycsar system effector family protein [Streptomyces sp. ISL-66]|uniref:Pycsar system effector family protein n=1 Tax=Streptomyces sp. ISL-66 TaxID=2819186 RepID=UPI0027E427F7|nr:Pycsar system effector family protein [Streptomyces sp. ISL-66]